MSDGVIFENSKKLLETCNNFCEIMRELSKYNNTDELRISYKKVSLTFGNLTDEIAKYLEVHSKQLAKND